MREAEDFQAAGGIRCPLSLGTGAGGCVAFSNSTGSFAAQVTCISPSSYTAATYSGSTCSGTPLYSSVTVLPVGCQNSQTQACVSGTRPAPPSDGVIINIYVGSSCAASTQIGWASENCEHVEIGCTHASSQSNQILSSSII